ncbi:amino acid adenylation domain-containing protein, partial [Nonomuraea muscovyensis]
MTERGGGLFVNWDAVEELFPAGVLDGMFEAYVGIVRKLVAGEWSEPVGGLVPAGQLAVRAGVNATAGAVSGRLLHAGFFEWAGREPGRVALLWDGGSLSYGELAGRALAVAGWLRGGGVAPGGLVGVSVRRGPDQVAAVLGVLAAGAAYVPVGVDQPEVRRERIFASAGVSCVLTDEVMAEALAASPVGVPVWADGLAYVIYTSGSTGEPKGVEITHAAAVNTVEDVVGRFGVSGGDRVLAVSALDFDLSVFDVFGLLSVGGSLVLIGEEDRREAGRWAQLCERFGVSVWNSVPALLDMLLTVGGGGGLRLALVSGDWVGLDLSARLAAVAPGAELVALGGATEAAIWSNFMPVPVRVPRGWVSVPYGRPLRNQRFRVVDGRGRDCPDWVPGELWIGGAGVALGYRNDPERTAAQFVTVGGERWYRTGDVGRYWPDGVLEFLGRRDFQVKVRGHRIELGEVEAVLEACPGVSRAVAAAVEVSGGRSRRLAALVVGGQAERVREFAASRLPGYMVPERVVVVEALPLSGNGKIDRAAALRLL